jgi:hypothetical protein
MEAAAMRTAGPLLALVLLAFCGDQSHACQLSLVGAVIQQPLNYDPFDTGPSQAAITFTLKNADGSPCEAAFAFFNSGAPRATGPGGSLAYQILAPSASIVQSAVSPPAALLSSSSAQYVTIGSKQTYTAKVTLFIPEGQVVSPGAYSGSLYLGVYQRQGSGQYEKSQIPAVPFNPIINVNSQMTVAIAGGGRKTTLNFGDFVEGATRSVQLQVYSNLKFQLAVSSDNAGVMKPLDKQALAEGIWQVPYTLAVNRSTSVTLSQSRAFALWPSATQKSGIAIPIDVRIGAITGQRAGVYRDVITITIDAAP